MLSVQDANPAKRNASLVEPIAFLGGGGVAPTLLRRTGQIAPAAFHNHRYALARTGRSLGFWRALSLTAVSLAAQHQHLVAPRPSAAGKIMRRTMPFAAKILMVRNRFRTAEPRSGKS